MQASPLQMLGLFVTRVWAFDLEPARAEALNRHLRREIEALLSPRPKVMPGQTWQTHHDLHKRAAFAPFLEVVTAASAQVLEELKTRSRDLVVTGCWANVNAPGLPHGSHNHPNNYLSGVYYVQTGPGADSITFLDPRPQVLQIYPRYAEQSPLNATELNVPAPEGRLLLFPGWAGHAVPANRGNQERISVSFNLMFRDYEALARPAWGSDGSS